jgi:hypothetical protein
MKLYSSIILPWLLHHANRLGRNEHFYKIKNKILNRFGTFITYDVQFIEGKKCHSCHGTGVHHYYDDEGEIYDTDFCWRCHNGWYKRPTWNILKLVSFGKYKFHQPYQTVYGRPDNNIPVFEGYICHNTSKYSRFALNILFLIYDKHFIKRWYKGIGTGWRCYWYLPRNWLATIIHFIKHGRDSYPIKHLRGKYKRKKVFPVFETIDCELPF